MNTPAIHTPDNNGWVDHLTERWVEATVGGRLITQRAAHFVETNTDPWVREAMAASDTMWRSNIDAMGGWRGYVAYIRSQPIPEATMTLSEAEAMLEWPIYQVARGTR